ncbi:NAD(P)-dependent dehydrogenase, short-chain alcohol dehydrogenase family [Limimonas halophila]|uniref:NAD(P)-dependent dehydrogenase, short-chain alcohol dehydrogenase family n=1 Tax=Limimonas halophila TaxID=1082479 RepID=A0A1G7UN39_9PROT|nr:SDR family oxidoreductase [Limimonas halophila]SDG48897.1 NAD(P)-dependent dehydrogenase, short-chain alcohol dehydrogenase family [Limimonas halophila]
MGTALITGASRGIGLAFARRLAADGWRVHGCCRMPEKARALKDVEGDVECHRLDVTNGLHLRALGRELADEPLDLLINNAGIFGPRGGFGRIAYEDWLQVFDVNTLGPMRVAEAFVRHLERAESPKLINLSSRLGSIAENDSSGWHLYRSSKAALNMVTKCMAIDLAPRGVVVAALHPGWVRTDMGGRSAPVVPDDSVDAMLATIDRLGTDDSGGFYASDGEPIPW